MAYKLYNSPLSPYAARCRIQMYAKGLDVELLDMPGAIDVEEFVNLTPMHKVPTLDHDGVIIPESQVIAEYWEEAEKGVSLLPDDAQARAQVRLIARICDLYIMLPMGKLFGQINPKSRDEVIVKDMFEHVERGLGWLEHYIDGSAYAVGDQLTLADCVLMPVLYFVSNITPLFGRDCILCDTPAVHQYYEATQADPHVARVYEEVETAFGKMMGR